MKKPNWMSDELYSLIMNTESMSDIERESWFNTFPYLKPEEIDRLYNILKSEKDRLEELELQYQEDVKILKLNRVKNAIEDFKSLNLSLLEKLKLLFFN